MKTFVGKERPYATPVLTGKYGRYAKINGINYSEKKMLERGFSIAELNDVAFLTQINTRKEEERKHEKELMKAFIEKKCKEISFTFLDGKDITSVAHFKEMSENVGQLTQGSDSHENTVLIDKIKYLARKHWSNDGIGIWITNEAGELNGCVGEIHFFENKVYLQKYEVA